MRIVVVVCLLASGIAVAGTCPDEDGDGFFAALGCETARDCNDADVTIHPAALDACDGIDNDCDGIAEESCDATCFAPLENLINAIAIVTSNANLREPRIAWNGQEYLVLWLDDRDFGDDRWEIYLRRYNAALEPLEVVRRLTVRENPDDYYTWLGDAPVVWGGDSYGLLMDTFNTGEDVLVVLDRFGNEIQRQSVGLDATLHSNLIWDGAGFVFVYGSQGHLWLARYDDRGQPRGAATQVSTATGDYTNAVLRGSGDGYAVAYSTGGEIRVALLDAAGQRLGQDPLVESASSTDFGFGFSGATYLLVWRDRRPQGAFESRFDAELGVDGSILLAPGPHEHNSTPDDLRWIGAEYVASTEHGVDLRRVSASGSPIGESFTVLTSRPGDYAWNGRGFVGVNTNTVNSLVWLLFKDCDCSDYDGDGHSRCLECDDANDAVYPGAPGICDGLNNDCGHASWPALVDTEEVDDDADGFAECAGDCDDTRADSHPGASQVCDGRNNDCAHPAWPALTGTNEGDDDGDGFSECAGDCDDAHALILPGAEETCDGINNNCLAHGWPALPAAEIDADGDGFRACQECDDGAASVSPTAPETCNAVDDNCNGEVDEDALGEDTDGDAVQNLCDNCSGVYNPAQLDLDLDGHGNSCDNCAQAVNPGQEDLDADARGDLCDNCPSEFNPLQDDFDQDSVGDACDNCFFDCNPWQSDTGGGIAGDACDLDDGMVYLVFTASSDLEWQQESGFAAWNVYRGDLRLLVDGDAYTQKPGSNALAGRACSVGTVFDSDAFTPGEGLTAFYLISGAGVAEGDLGANSDGFPRPNTAPCP